jgi:hypothetical protein
MIKLKFSYSVVYFLKTEYAHYQLPLIIDKSDEREANSLADLFLILLKDAGFNDVKRCPIGLLYTQGQMADFISEELYVLSKNDLLTIDFSFTLMDSSSGKGIYKISKLYLKRTKFLDKYLYDNIPKIVKLEIPLLILSNKSILREHELYKSIPKSTFKFRIDKAYPQFNIQRHIHIYDKKGNEIYSVNFDGTGHDGHHNELLSNTIADFLRDLGFSIRSNNLIESSRRIISSENYYGISLFQLFTNVFRQ